MIYKLPICCIRPLQSLLSWDQLLLSSKVKGGRQIRRETRDWGQWGLQGVVAALVCVCVCLLPLYLRFLKRQCACKCMTDV